jgi:hypothetical protein
MDTPGQSGSVCVLCCADCAEGSTSLSLERTCRDAVDVTPSGRRFQRQVVGASLDLLGNVCLGHLLYEREGNLFKMSPGRRRIAFLFCHHPGTVPGRRSYGSHLLGGPTVSLTLRTRSISGSCARRLDALRQRVPDLCLTGRVDTCQACNETIRLRHVILRCLHGRGGVPGVVDIRRVR